jgi:FMN phosphatase YigB (HAD superfamily)
VTSYSCDGTERPCGTWCAIEGDDGNGGRAALGIVSDAKHGFSAIEQDGRGVLRLTLLRSPGYATHDPHRHHPDEDLDFLMARYLELEARPGVAECFSLLRRAGFTVWAFTAGDVERVRGYFVRNGIDMPLENFRSCDQIRVGKPAPEAYRSMLDGFVGEEAWFAAAHMWDVSAAKSMG